MAHKIDGYYKRTTEGGYVRVTDQEVAREHLVEHSAERVHDTWMDTKRRQGVTSRLSESGEELMVPYAELSEAAKDLDRGSVRASLNGFLTAPHEVLAAAMGGTVRTERFVGELRTVIELPWREVDGEGEYFRHVGDQHYRWEDQ